MQQQTLLLVLKKMQEAHSDENLMQLVFQTFDDYEIRDNLNYFVMNNAKNNNIMLKTIQIFFESNMILITIR